MTNRIIAGNIISLIAAILLSICCWIKDPKKVFLLQCIENLVYAASAIVFGSYSAAISTIITATRYYVAAKNRYRKKTMIAYTLVAFISGTMLNTLGIIGMLPVFATAQTAVCIYYFSTPKGIKWTFIVNLLLWDIYAFAILDFSSGIAWGIMIVISFTSLYKIKKKKKTEYEYSSSAAPEYSE